MLTVLHDSRRYRCPCHSAVRRTLLAKVDIESAYQLNPVHPDDRPLQVVQWDGSIYVDPMLPLPLLTLQSRGYERSVMSLHLPVLCPFGITPNQLMRRDRDGIVDDGWKGSTSGPAPAPLAGNWIPPPGGAERIACFPMQASGESWV